MSHRDTLHSNVNPTAFCCLSCLSSFGITEARRAHICENTKCGKRFCGDCINKIKLYNGSNKKYRCMYCLKSYLHNQIPKTDESLHKKLFRDATIKYGVGRTARLLSKSCTTKELLDDIKCRQYHLDILLRTVDQFFGHQTNPSMTVKRIRIMTDHLVKIMQGINQNGDRNINIAKESYQRAISPSNIPEDLAITYIELCEELQEEIANAEQRSLFSNTYNLEKQWLLEPMENKYSETNVAGANESSNRQDTPDPIHSKISCLFRAIGKDLKNQLTDPKRAPRVKIAVVGYASAGKSTLINRLLGKKSLSEEGAAMVLSCKCTYFPCRFDQREPLLNPSNSNKKTYVTLVDIQGDDENKVNSSAETVAGNYLDEIRKADCDIYIVVFNELLSEEQMEWVKEIKGTLNRLCILVRSKVDIEFLENFHETYSTFYSQMDRTQRIELGKPIIEKLCQESSFIIDNEDHVNHLFATNVENEHGHDLPSALALKPKNNNDLSRTAFLVCCNYRQSNIDAAELQKDQVFDLTKLRKELEQLATGIQRNRIHQLASRVLVHMINTCFRRSYIINVLLFQIGAGVASTIPFADQYPRYLSRDAIRAAFGIDDDFHTYLKGFDLTVHQYKLQTSVFEKSVKIDNKSRILPWDARAVGKLAGTGLVVVGASVLDDIVRAVPASATLLSGAGRIAFTTATLGVGLLITVAVSLWCAFDARKHIFSYVNRLCDDIIMIADEFVTKVLLQDLKQSMQSQEQRTNSNNHDEYT